MKRSLVLQIPVVILAGIIAGTLALTFWLIMLIPFLIRPSLTRPITSRISRAFTKQMLGFMMGGPKSTQQRSRQSVPESRESSGRSVPSLFHSAQTANLQQLREQQQPPKVPPTT
jgi:hypothetical protein